MHARFLRIAPWVGVFVGFGSAVVHAQDAAAPANEAPKAEAAEAEKSADAPAAALSPLAEIDELWTHRNKGDNAQRCLDKSRAYTEKNPNDFEGFWRFARAAFWVAERGQDRDDKELMDKLGYEGWQVAVKAQEMKPDRVEGWYWGAAALGQHAKGAGILNALFKGLGGKFEDMCKKAIQIDANYNYGGPLRTLGRYYAMLPAIKRDLDKSEKFLLLASKKFPMKIRNHYYLAETYELAEKADQAKAEYQACAAGDPGSEEVADGIIWKAVCEKKLAPAKPAE